MNIIFPFKAAAEGDGTVGTAEKVLAYTEESFNFLQKFNEIYPLYYKPANLNINEFGELTTNWISFYKEREQIENIEEEDVKVVLTNIMIDVSRSKKIITHRTNNGLLHTQLFNDGDYEITIEGIIGNILPSLPNYAKLNKLNYMMTNGLDLNIICPELEYIYGIDKVKIVRTSITDSTSYYNMKLIRIKMRSIFDKKIIE